MNELNAGHARTNDGHFLWEDPRRVAVSSGENSLVIWVAPLWNAWTSARCDERRIEIDLLNTVSRIDFNTIRASEASGSPDNSHTLAFQQLGRVVLHVVSNVAHSSHEGVLVDRRRGICKPHATDALAK